MNTNRFHREQGFVLIMTMLILLVLTILVVNAVRSSTLEEQMAGSYMDRNRAKQAAERALEEGRIKLTMVDPTDNPICLDGCVVQADGTVVALATGATGSATLPELWTDTNAGAEITVSNAGVTGATNASYRVALLADTFRGTDPDKVNCKPYSIMGRGQGIDNRTVVILQTIAYVCPLT